MGSHRPAVVMEKNKKKKIGETKTVLGNVSLLRRKRGKTTNLDGSGPKGLADLRAGRIPSYRTISGCAIPSGTVICDRCCAGPWLSCGPSPAAVSRHRRIRKPVDHTHSSNSKNNIAFFTGSHFRTKAGYHFGAKAAPLPSPPLSPLMFFLF